MAKKLLTLKDKELLGVYADDLASGKYSDSTYRQDSICYIARPLRYRSLRATIIRVWHVITGKADVIYWK